MYSDKRALTCLLILVFFVPAQLLSQTNINSPAVHSDTTKVGTAKHSFYGSLGYGSNLIYLGSTISQNQPYGYTALTYGYKDQLYLTVSAVHLHERDPFVAFSLGSINYSHAV